MGSNLHYRGRSVLLSVLAVSFFTIALSSNAWGITRTWLGGNGNNAQRTDWARPGNWSGNAVPGPADLAVIPTTPAGNPTAGFFPTISAASSVGQIQVQAGATVTVTGVILTVGNGTTSPLIDGTGTITGTGSVQVTNGPNAGVLINDSITLCAFTLNAPLGLNMTIPSGKTVTFNGNVALTQSEIHVGAAVGAASSFFVNGALTVGANGTLDMRAPASVLRVSGTLTLTGTWTAGTSTLLLNPTANQTLAITTGAPRQFYNVTLQSNADATGNNQADADLVTPSAGFIVNNDLALNRCQFQIGNFTVEVFGNTTSGPPTQSQLDFTNTGVFKAHGNVDLGSLSQISTQVSGPFATIEMAASVPLRTQTFQIHATTNSQYFDLDAFVVTNPGGVTVLDNPNAEFTVNGQLNIANNCTLVVQDVFDPESPLIMGTASVLRLENIISPDSSIMGSTFTAGTGTVIYAGQAVNQIVYAQQNNGNLIPYYNLSIDNAAGRVATQQTPLPAPIVALPLTVAGSFAVVGANSTFVANSPNMVVAQNFTVNGTFTHAGATVTMNGTGTIAGTAANLVFNNLLVSGAATTDVRTATRSFTANNQFRVTQGSLNTSGTLTMTALTEMLVGDGVGAAGTASLNLSGAATLAMGSGRTFSVSNVDGRFTSGKVGGVSPTVTHDAVGNTFLTSIGGQVDLYGLNFSFARYEGLNLTSTASITRLRDVRFTSIFPTVVVNQPPRHLSIAVAGLDLDCPGCYFESAAAGYFNVWVIGAGMRLRFEDRRTSGSTTYNGLGAGEAYDGDDDANDDGVVTAGETTALHNGALVQWVYTANIDMTGAIQGAPMPAFDFNNFGAYYSTYSIMRRPGLDTDTIYVLNSNGDIAYQLPALGAGSGNIVGPLWWDTEGATHIVYFGTTTGRVYKFIDNGSSLQQPASGVWSTHFSNATLTAVNSWIVSDQTNLYFGGANLATNGVYAVQISTKAYPVTVPANAWPISTATLAVTTAPSWYPTTLGPSLFLASNAVPTTSNIYRVKTSTPAIDSTFTKTTPVTMPTYSPSPGAPATTVDYCNTNFVAPTNVAFNNVLYVGESNGWMHGLPALGTTAQFLVPAAGFPFRDKVSAITGGATYDFVRGRLFFGNAAGDVYFLGTYNSSWRIGPYNAGTQPNPNYFRFATAGGASIPFAPLYEAGVLYVTNSAGKVFIFDADATVGAAPPAGPNLMRTYNFFSNGTTSDISRDYSTNRLYVANAAGRLYSIDAMSNLAGTQQ